MKTSFVLLTQVGPLQTTLLGMGTVFLVLLILMYSIKVMTKVFSDKPKEKVEESTAPVAVTPVAPAVVQQGEDEELIAVLMAAVMAASDNEKIIALRSVRMVGNPLPIWTKMGVEEMMK